jgi:hypothetical protein
MIVVLDLDRTLNCLSPAGTRSIRELAPAALVKAGGEPLWRWLTDHLSRTEYPVNSDALLVLEELRELAPTIVVNTGRPEGSREVTEHWLGRYVKINYLLMRAAYDFRPTVEVKRDNLTRQIMPFYRTEEMLAFEDNATSVQMYQQTGIRTFSAPECWIKLRDSLRAGMDIMDALSSI